MLIPRMMKLALLGTVVFGVAETLFGDVQYSFTTIQDPLGYATLPDGINNSGQIAGYYLTAGGVSHGFLYNGGVFTTIDYPGATSTSLLGVNNSGQVLGEAAFGPIGSLSYFIYSDGTYTNITLPANGQGINDSGQIVGYGLTVQNAYTGFLYINGSYTVISDPNSVGDTGAFGISDNGQIVGFYIGPPGGFDNGFLYSGASFTTINYPSGSDTELAAINNGGQIVGTYFKSAATPQPFLYSAAGRN
jgi:probable HAF family extracellular repeat protein